MFEKYLQDIGLNEKEALIYVSLLQVDNVSVLELSKKTGINRSTTYVILDSLSKKGLVSEIQISKKIHYQAEPPERLETYVERQRVNLDEQAKRLKDVIPQLKSVKREMGERPIIKYFDGREGVISALENYFEQAKSGGESYAIYSRDLIDQIFTEAEKQKFKKIRVGKDLYSKAIYTFSKGDLPTATNGTQARINDSKYPIYCDIGIYNDEVRINTLSKSISAMVIKNSDFAETLKSLINYIIDNQSK